MVTLSCDDDLQFQLKKSQCIHFVHLVSLKRSSGDMQIVHSIEASIPKISQSIGAVMCFDDPTRTRDDYGFASSFPQS